MSDLYDKQHDAEIVRLNDRITELEASLADAIEVQQVLGLKLSQAEGHSANIGLQTRDGARILMLPGANILIVGSDGCELVSIYSGSHTRHLNCFEESFVLAALDYSANTVGGPTPVMDASPAWEMMAIAWLRGKAAGQAQNNERWPDHAKCYPRWTLYVDIAQELANELEREHQKREDTRNAGESDR